MRLSIALFCAATLFAGIVDAAECPNSINITPKDWERCETMLPKDRRPRCFQALFGDRTVIALSEDFIFKSAIVKPIGSLCVNGLRFPDPGRDVSMMFSKRRLSTCLSNFGYVELGRLRVTGSNLCVRSDGTFPHTLSNDFRYIPASTKIEISGLSIRSETVVAPNGGGVILRESAKICGADFPTGANLGVSDSDGHYHFVAPMNAKLTVINEKGETKSLHLKKGIDYRNPHPDKFPCDWSETPKMVECSSEQYHLGQCPEVP